MIREKKHASQLMMPLDQQQSSSTSSSEKFANVFSQTEPADFILYKAFFHANQYPAIIIDLNVNIQKARPNVQNFATAELLAKSECFFERSHLEGFNGSLSEFVCAAKKKVLEKIAHLDVLNAMVRSSSSLLETQFFFTAFSLDIENDERMLGIMLIEISEAVKEELNAVKVSKNSLIAALSHELNNPMNSLIPLLKMMPSCINGERKDDLKEMALSSASILQSKIRDAVDFATIELDVIRLSQVEFYVDELFNELNNIFKYEGEGE
eukprot:TRINITY_DN5171_c0_g1_i6.p1 TRINITY_DN5171_c0_g1~~TRINITY_DN5171_c0_g1_i6.p1  ORF type:complete len:267 (+),score=59.55 TRINITY_DN5171_c0_g1_i6:192-992(+)